MRKAGWLPGSAALLCALSTTASAQSNVTLSGRIDSGFAYLNQVQTGSGTSTSRFSAQSGDWGTGMLNFSGTEDLGNGFKTIFILSRSLKAVTGTAGAQNRKSWVGLSNDRYGTIKFGRDLFISNGVSAIDPFVQELFGSASLVRGRNWQQTNNNIGYLSPSYRGFDVAGQYSLGGEAGNWNGTTTGSYGRSDGLQLTYRAGLVDIRAIYDEMRDANGHFSNVFTASREFTIGANVHLGPFIIQGAATRMIASDTPGGLASTANHYWLGTNYQVSPYLLLTVGAYHIDVGNGAGNATHDAHGHATMYVIGSTYNLSKRTFLYATGGYVRNSAGSTFSLEPNNPGMNNSNLDNPLPGKSQLGAYFGINHSF
ncbi:porin [Paraburkholderia sp.]|uniref:porin n=1 Tax=Paraburkholderia sp. TaxID=1926495 RepID=UPI002389634A|nr:porin [Paraburkholderia sp.]MDE1179330.1 porin [Paraburkholderia sp.]